MKPQGRDAARSAPPPERPSRAPRARFAGRAGAVAIALALGIVVLAQYRGIVARNLALASELAHTRADVDALHARQRRELREIARLQSPEGAIPEIHDKLRMVGKNEELILLKGDVPPTAEPSLSNGDEDQIP